MRHKFGLALFGVVILNVLPAFPVQSAQSENPNITTEKIAGTPVDDLSEAHDYRTVDISTLNTWERTFVPEWRKKPIFEALLKDVDWKLQLNIYDQNLEKLVPVKDAAQCNRLLRDLKEWEEVKIMEPEIRANRYYAPAFDEKRQQCPTMAPHYIDDSQTLAVGTHNFKSYRIPELRKGENLFYFSTAGSIGDFDLKGRIKPNSWLAKYLAKDGRDFVPREGNGFFQVINFDQCQMLTWLPAHDYISFDYFDQKKTKPRYSESAVFSIAGKSYVISAHVRNPIDWLTLLWISDFNSPYQKYRTPLCKFEGAPNPYVPGNLDLTKEQNK